MCTQETRGSEEVRKKLKNSYLNAYIILYFMINKH